MIELHRVYDHHATRGTRFLVERLWPRGIKKESLHFSDWLKEAAPSDSLRRWFQHDVSKWPEFQRRYRRELDEHPDAWEQRERVACYAWQRGETCVWHLPDT